MKLVVLIKALKRVRPHLRHGRFVRGYLERKKEREQAREAFEEMMDSAERHPHRKHHGMGIFDKSLEPFMGALNQPLSVQVAYWEHNKEARKQDNQKRRKKEQLDRLAQAPKLAVMLNDQHGMTEQEKGQYGPRFMATRWTAVERDLKKRKAHAESD